MGQLWIYRNNARFQGETVSSGQWREFVRQYGRRGPTEWGSTKWIRSRSSRKIIREELDPGDLFLCWQTDERAAIGLARLTKLEQRGEWTDLILEPVLEFPAPVRLRELAEQDASLRQVGFIAKHSQGTLARASADDADILLLACGVDPKTLDVTAVFDGPRRLGTGFGNPEENRRVESAGMSAVREALENQDWDVDEVSRTRGIGYDLRATRGRSEDHVEVKAVRGTARSFIITEGELQASKTDRRWRLALVTEALTRPTITWYSPSELRELEIRAVSHIASDPHT
jgi:hypothetical protein